MSIIERIQQGLDERPSSRLALTIARTVLGHIAYVIVWTGAITLAVVFVGALVLALALAGLIAVALPMFPDLASSGIASPEAQAEAMSRVLTILVVVGVLVGLLHCMRRIGRDLDADTRSRVKAARDVVAQAIVAEGVGAQVHRLGVGLVSGGWLGYAQPGSVRQDEASAADRGVVDLAVLLAAPSFGSEDFEHRELQRGWREQAAELDHEVRIARALDPAREGTGDPMAEASLLARRVLAWTPDEERERIEGELLRAGSLRGERFRVLMKDALPDADEHPVPPSEAEPADLLAASPRSGAAA